MAQRLPRFRRAELEAEDTRKIARLVEEQRSGWRTNHHDPRRLRGLPAVGRDATSPIPGTDPLGVLLAHERRRTK